MQQSKNKKDDIVLTRIQYSFLIFKIVYDTIDELKKRGLLKDLKNE